ncbi:MAG: DUF1844 domain-containing protein [Candidatus Binatia bacterium]
MADQEEKQEGKGFTVQDRRRFSETGEAREDVPDSPNVAPSEPAAKPAGTASEMAQEPLPEINFSTFIISLSTQALMHLGEIADPLSGTVNKDIPVAKQMIDIIGMLKDKTKGNLNAGEEKLTEEVLFDLRMKYVEAVKKK